MLPRKGRAPTPFDIGTGEGSHSTTVEDDYHQAYMYFEVLDLAIASISDHFNQPGYAIYENHESLIVSATTCKCEPFDQHLKKVEF